MGPNDGFYTQVTDVLPPQMIPLKEKLQKNWRQDKTWGEVCMDTLENIGKQHYQGNLLLIENYEMIKGRFYYKHYFDEGGYKSMMNQLSEEFEIPSNLRHYDIISPVINTLSGEWQKRPDIFKIKELGDNASNEYLRTKQDLTKKYVMAQITAEIDKYLMSQGIDIEKKDFASQEEAQQYQQQIQAYRQERTPKEIQDFMDTDFLTQAEIWAQHQKDYDREYFNLPEKEKVEFEDMLIADRCFRHFYITPTGYNQETWNPVNTFFHKSPDINEAENGDYVGRTFNISINTIIDRYGHKMDKTHFDLLQNKAKTKKTKWQDSEFDWVYDDYYVPFSHYPSYEIMKNSWNKSSGDIPQLEESFFQNINTTSYDLSAKGFYFVTEGYWKTQKKLIKITYFDEEVQDTVVTIVDENFIMPKQFSESNRIFDDSHDINTYVETYITEIWKGVKINTGIDKDLMKDIYLGIGPNDFQFKGDMNIYGSKLPVCGQVFSIRNSRSMSLVDMMKPHQIGYNMMVNQMYQLAEKEIGMFLVMDVNMFPDAKDWGGEDAWEKWMMIAKNVGMLPADTSPANIKGSLGATGGYLPKVLDLNLAGQMVSRQNLAAFFKQEAMTQVGFNDYRLGSFAQSSTAEGIAQGTERSYSQTETYFTNFSNYVRRCIKMSLDISQHIQSKKEHITINYVKSDLSRAFIKILGTDILLSELGVMVTNSMELERQLNMMRTYAVQNNTAGLTPPNVMDVIAMNSPKEIRRQIQAGYDKMMASQKQQFDQTNKIQSDQIEYKNAAVALQDKQFNDKLANELNIARLKAGVDLMNSPTQQGPATKNSEQYQTSREIATMNDITKREKLDIEKQKITADAVHNQQMIALKQQEIGAQIQIQNKETETARILKEPKVK